MTDAEFQAQVDHMKREGYTVLPDMLAPEECDTAQRELDSTRTEIGAALNASSTVRISVKITTCFGFNLPPRRSAATLVV